MREALYKKDIPDSLSIGFLRVEVNMKFYLTNRQLVEVEEAVGPVINWEERSVVNCDGVKNFEQMWAVKCRPETIPDGIPLSDALALNKKILSKIEG